MPATVYQINRNLRQSVEVQKQAVQIMSSFLLNAVQGFGRSIDDISLDGSGRLRVRLNDALPSEEIATFEGDVIAV